MCAIIICVVSFWSILSGIMSLASSRFARYHLVSRTCVPSCWFGTVSVDDVYMSIFVEYAV